MNLRMMYAQARARALRPFIGRGDRADNLVQEALVLGGPRGARLGVGEGDLRSVG
jgi:hypothetical protein